MILHEKEPSKFVGAVFDKLKLLENRTVPWKARDTRRGRKYIK